VSLCREGKPTARNHFGRYATANSPRAYSWLEMEQKPRVQLSAITPPSTPVDTSLHRPSDNMGLRDRFRDLLCIPRKDRRAQGEARSEADAAEAPREANLAMPRPVESTPDLRIGASKTLPMSSPLAPRDQETSDTQTALPHATALTNPPPNTGNSVVLDHNQSAPREGERLEPLDHVPNRGAATENKSNWKSTAYSSAKVVIDVAKESSEVFPPLKAAVGGLAAILKHYDVWSNPPTPSTILTITPAIDGQSENDRIVDTAD
jgi:hypothetical protein